MQVWLPTAVAIVMAAPAANAPVPPDAVALVEGAPISRVDFDAWYTQMKRRYEREFNIDFSADEGKTAEKDLMVTLVDQLIKRQIVLNEAKRRDIQVTDAQIDRHIAELEKKHADHDAFLRSLTEKGVSFSDLKAQTRESLLVEGLMLAMTPTVTVTDKDVADYYAEHVDLYELSEDVRLSHILVKNERVATEVFAKLKAGGDFAALAKAHSQDRESDAKGGDIGYFTRDDLTPEFAAVFGWKPGQTSGLIKSDVGYHIVLVTDRRAATTLPLAKVKDEIRDLLVSVRRATHFSTWLEARSAAAIIILSPALAEATHGR